MTNKQLERMTADKHVDLLVRADKLQLLYRQSFPATFVSYLVALILTYVLWPVQQHIHLITWLSLLAVASLLRLVLFINYMRLAPHDEQVLKWEKPYFVTLIFSSLVWGIGVVFIMPADSDLHQAVIFFFLMGMSGGGNFCLLCSPSNDISYHNGRLAADNAGIYPGR
jgi:hypothetical protein